MQCANVQCHSRSGQTEQPFACNNERKFCGKPFAVRYLDFRSVSAGLLAEAGRARAERRHPKVRLSLRPRHVARLRIVWKVLFPLADMNTLHSKAVALVKFIWQLISTQLLVASNATQWIMPQFCRWRWSRHFVRSHNKGCVELEITFRNTTVP